MNEKIKEIKKIVGPIVESNDLLLDSIEIEMRDSKKALVITINKEEGMVNVDDCSKISRLIGPIIEEYNFIKEKYLLIVSSPGS
jgi:ribosome maturation factor RimP